MVKIRATTLLAGYGAPQPMGATGAKAMQIYGPGGVTWAKKGLIIRNAPYTIENPHIGQIETRIHFGGIATKAKGMKGLDPDTGYPWAAAYVHKEMPGYRAAHRKPADWKPKRSFRTVAELRVLAEKKIRAEAKRAVPARPIIPREIIPL